MSDTETLLAESPENHKYDESSITVLEGIEHVRKRPSMYIGDTYTRGLHHCVYEVVDNSIDEAMAGFCKTISLTIRADNTIVVEDDGRGIPVGWMKEHNMSALEACLTQIGAGGKFDRNSYKVSGGLHGVGVSAVNALSDRLSAVVQREGHVWSMSFERGRPLGPLAKAGDSERTGTRIEFHPDPQIFPDITFHYDVLAKRLRELAYLNAGLRINITDEREGRGEQFFFAEGLKEFIKYLNDGKGVLHETVGFKREDAAQRLILDCAFQYTDGYTETMESFANNINTIEGGTHLSGFRAALTRAVNNYARKENLLKANDPVPQGEDIREGITAIVSVKVPEPQFEGQTKTKLGNSEVGTFVETTVNELLTIYLEEHPADAKRLVNKGVQAAVAREAARKARETARKSAMSGGGLSKKLVDCSSRNVDETELYIVEGDSAAGSAKGYRDAERQAILPIRGKILNVEKARMHKVLGHEEILEIIKALGTGIGEDDFDATKLRYGRIIFMTDADVDGSHIRTLLLTFFFRHLRPLIELGRIYIAQPPLYQLAKGKTVDYVLDDPALARKLTELGLARLTLEIRRPGDPPRALTAGELRELVELISEVERQSKVLARRGILFEAFVEQRSNTGQLPAIRAQTSSGEQYFYSDAEFEAFRQEQAAHGINVIRGELAEARALQRCFARLADFGCSVDDLFLKREELITGELSPAIFVLQAQGEKEPLELPNLRELTTGVQEIGGKGWEIKRFKGLGEMNKEELWETTMNPANRVMRRVVVSELAADPEQSDLDAREADHTFSILMGEDVDKRRSFIETNAIRVKNLDI